MAETHPFEDFTPAEKHPLLPLHEMSALRQEFVDMRNAVGQEGLSRQKVSEITDLGESTIARIENNPLVGITWAKAHLLLDCYVVAGTEREKIEARIETENEFRKKSPVWQKYKSLASSKLLPYWGYEAQATNIKTYQLTFLPEFMQPQKYADALNALDDFTFHNPEQRIAAAAAREQRAAYLLGKFGPPMDVIIEESALVRSIDGEGNYDITNAAIDGLKYLNTIGRQQSGEEIPEHLNPRIGIQVVAMLVKENQQPSGTTTETGGIFDPYDCSIFGFGNELPEGRVFYFDSPTYKSKLSPENDGNYRRKFESQFDTRVNALPPPEKTNAILDGIKAANAARSSRNT